MENSSALDYICCAIRGFPVRLSPIAAQGVRFIKSWTPITGSNKQSAWRSPQTGILHEDLTITRPTLFADVKQSAAYTPWRSFPPGYPSAAPRLLAGEFFGSLGIAVVGYYRLCLQLAKAS